MNQISEIQCGDQLTIAKVAELYPQLQTVLADGQAVSIDLQQVSRVDTAGLQLLYAFSQQAQQQSLVVMWSAPSTIIEDAVETIGMTPFFSIDTAGMV